MLPQKVLRTALARTGLVEYWVHTCRRCKRRGDPHSERHADGELRPCPRCGMKLWPTAKVRPMRFHDLRHSVVTLLLRERVDAHRVQRLLRHRDVKTTTGTYGHLVVEDLREAINLLPPAPFAASLLQDPGSTPPDMRNSTIEISENQVLGLERETGFEPATLSLGKYESRIAGVNKASQAVATTRSADDAPFQPTPPEASFSKHFASPLLPDFSASLTVKEVAARLRVCAATIYRLCTTGELPHFRVGATIRIRDADLARYCCKTRSTGLSSNLPRR